MFSQIVDDVCKLSNRIDMRDIVVKLAQGIISRIHSKQYFQSDLKQLELTPDTPNLEMQSATKWVWRRNPDVRLINSVCYKPLGLYPPNNQPSVGQNLLNNYWYKVGEKYVFVFGGGQNVLGEIYGLPVSEEPTSIEITYYSFPKKFEYIPEAERLIKYDWSSNEWLVREDAQSDEWKALDLKEVNEREEELTAYGNWLLRDYKDVVISGTLSKLYGLLDDSERFKREFAEFNQLFAVLVQNERYANFGY